jgi:predicted PurR-regulated permease PerM
VNDQPLLKTTSAIDKDEPLRLPDAEAIAAQAAFIRLTLSAAQTFFLGGIFTFCLLAVCYVAANILLPILLALLLKFVLHPFMRNLQRWHIPASIAAFLIIGLLFTLFIGVGSAVSEPIATWTTKIQDALPKLQEQVSFIKDRLAGMHQALSNAEHIVPGADTKTMVVSVRGTTLSDRLLAGTGHLASGLLETVVFLFFLLMSGDTFLRRLVEVLPRFQDKKHAVGISQQIENDLSAYLMTITLANLGVGIATGIAMHFCHIDDPLLWASLAWILNYIPIIGPVAMLGIIVLIGSLTFPLPLGLLAAGIFMIIHLAESQFITPLLLARRFTLNPVMIILSLTIWFWMWGIVGAILATPILAVIKIICDRIDPLKPLGHLIEGGNTARSERAA